MKRVVPKRALYIKLGSGGEWEHECIYENQTLRLGYIEVDHDTCARGEWDKVQEQRASFRSKLGAATRDVNQIREFYEAGEDVLWVTFHANLLWWCYSRPEVTQLPDRTKTRPVIGSWRCTDIERRDLRMDQLSGRLLSMQAFRGTICSVREFDYLINKINGSIPERVKEAEVTLSNLVNRLENIIQDLHWKDFEILIDLIFRQAGWQRVGILGGTQKTLDLDLLSPITGDRYCVQVKSKANLSDLPKLSTPIRGYEGIFKVLFCCPFTIIRLERSY